MVVHNFERPERFIAGTVGPPGRRTFFLQAREGPRVTSVALEKEQVHVLAERIDALLDEVLQRGGEGVVPAIAPRTMRDNDPLEQPIVEEFRVGTITLAWDGDDDRVIIELFPVSDVVAEADEEADAVEVEIDAEEVVIVKLDAGYARAFVQRAEQVVSAGRPPCPFCGGPLDPDGHLCPRANGFKRVGQ